MRGAASQMARAVRSIRNHCTTRGIEIDPTVDPNRTGLIGPEVGELWTTVGHLEAKRTTTSPDMAALMAHLLERAGVGPGGSVGIASSASFPGLLVATVCAADALEARPVVILSLGASSYGATRPAFHLLDLHQLLMGAGLLAGPPAAVSLGGELDAGLELEPTVKRRLLDQIREGGHRLIMETDLRANVSQRMSLYEEASDGAALAAFVNIGGSRVALGTSPHVLRLPPGLLLPAETPAPMEGRGLLEEMRTAGIPVIHLLYIRGLAQRYGIPWDPVPLPTPGTSDFRDPDAAPSPRGAVLAGLYLAGLAGVFGLGRRRDGSDKG
jgi:poly-gamma-glutamate system protein